ncbi:selenide, water dikinase SelD [Sulfitobacter sabulilitoris]|uniref:Selenide, water dikinase SelD n=1 Tax=Sulfitobacter sabulilitoris TaxID=2562655 RepID=A0A5S3PI66_9RHOB|nr:selenide, water dikinase SelD [Sulfitobacter sabulilitoris]TMM54044.1 selenide, water dikinase SelD [Sulfitobacter sabulilitoris]
MQAHIPLTRDLVLIGGGHAHALVLRRWGMNPLPGTRLTLINPGPTAPYTGMLPGHVAGHYTRDELDIDLVRLARFAGARLILGAVTGIDTDRREAMVPGHGAVGYDVASLDIGITAQMPQIDGFAEHGIAAKPLDRFAAAWREMLAGVRTGDLPAQVAVIGGGVAGVELSMAMAHALRTAGARAQVTLIEAETTLTGTGPATRARLMRALGAQGVTCRFDARVAQVTDRGVTLETGDHIPARLVVGAAGATPHDWLRDTGLPLRDGFIRVGPTLQVAGHDGLFAVGDCAHLAHAPRPKAGVFAVRAAPVLHDNLRAALSGRAMRAFRPQKRYLKLISLGGRSALAEKYGLPLSGPLLWRWKDRIDRAFMDRLGDLPQMAVPPAPVPRALDDDDGNAAAQPLCGACGSKVGAGVLGAALAGFEPRRDDVLSRPGDDAAVLRLGETRQVLTTDHLRGFTGDPAMQTRIAAVHAMGDIWAMGAEPQAALCTVILPRMSPPLQARSMAEILDTARAVFGAAGADVVGGHSSMGSELTIGFSVTGLCPGDPITQAGARADDAILLTRPIGSGTILAAEMAGRARGRDVAAMLARMATPQGDAAAILRGAHAMTDVTGFGLAGHLMAICRASGVGARITLDAIPLYSGAQDLAAAGHRSTIHADNLAHAPVAGARGPRGALLHDPQTAGGLLAAVAAQDARALVDRLRAAGHEAALIGRFTSGPPALRVAD